MIDRLIFMAARTKRVDICVKQVFLVGSVGRMTREAIAGDWMLGWGTVDQSPFFLVTCQTQFGHVFHYHH